MKRFRELLNEFSGWVDAVALVVAAAISVLAPGFLHYETTRFLSILAGLIGIAGGALWGLYLRKERRVRGWLGVAAGAIVSLVASVTVLAIADGSLPDKYPGLRWLYEIFFAAPHLGDVAFAACYAIFWACVASLVRFLAHHP